MSSWYLERTKSWSTHLSVLGQSRLISLNLFSNLCVHWANQGFSVLALLICCSVTKSCPTLCNPMDCSTPGFPVLHYLPEFAQTHVHGVNAIQPSYPLQPASHPALNLPQHQGLYQWVSSSHQVAKVLELQLQRQSFQWIFRVDFLSDWLVGSPCCLSKGLSRALLIFWIISCSVVGGYPVYYRMLSNSPGLYPSEASMTYPLLLLW